MDKSLALLVVDITLFLCLVKCNLLVGFECFTIMFLSSICLTCSSPLEYNLISDHDGLQTELICQNRNDTLKHENDYGNNLEIVKLR